MLENKLMSKAELKDFTFKSRHIGPTDEDEASMLQSLGYENSEEFISSVIPNEIFDLEKIPPSITIIGCGVIGIEYASMFANLGVSVTVIDGRNRPLEFLDTEIIDELIFQMKKKEEFLILHHLTNCGEHLLRY